MWAPPRVQDPTLEDDEPLRCRRGDTRDRAEPGAPARDHAQLVVQRADADEPDQPDAVLLGHDAPMPRSLGLDGRRYRRRGMENARERVTHRPGPEHHVQLA